MLENPPNNIPPEILFRQMLEVPRPKRKLQFKFDETDIDLYVQSISSEEYHNCCYSNLNNTIDFDIISKCLIFKNGEKVFESSNDIKSNILETEFKKLKEEFYPIISEISPVYYFTNSVKWNEKLIEGARHFSNYITMQALGSCFQLTIIGEKVLSTDFPERWFDVPKKELIDCHWMAYRAAKSAYHEIVFPKPSPEEAAKQIKKLVEKK